MKRIAALLVGLVFGATLVSAPMVALSVPGNTCNPPAGHGRSGCHRVTPPPVVSPPASVPGTPTVTARPAGPAKVKIKRRLRLTGTVSPVDASGTVTIVKTRLVGRKWKSAGSTKVALVDGKYSFSFKPTKKGKWRFVAKYSGSMVGTEGFAPSKSAIKNVRVY